ncbi:MAG: hypothetical protein HDR35_00115 [Treponema sp.]|nr:hypothetical protein [Treponema sp.]MBD5438232.1 hypothetical protein [Treponema sp.]
MKIKPLLEKLNDRWPAKAICIVAACVLYMFNQHTSLERRSLAVRLNVLQEGEMLCTTHLPSSVSVTIRTNAENISHVNAEGITATLDLNYITKEGNFDVPVLVSLPSNLESLDPLEVTVYPEKIKVHLEKNISRAVKVVPYEIGRSPYGYMVKKISVTPPYVEIFGPRSIVENVNALEVGAVVIDEKTESFSERKRIINRNRLVKIDGASEVEVNVEVGLVQGTKSFSNVPIELKNLNPEFEIEGNFFANFSIMGAQLVLDEYEILPGVLSADLGAISEAGEYEIPVTVLLPQDFHLESISVESISISVREKIPVILDESGER